MNKSFLQELADTMALGSLLEYIQKHVGSYEILSHWKQGEFHHDLLLRVNTTNHSLAGPILVVATNCNGGVKEVLCFAEVPDRQALWHWRCPHNSDFSGPILPILDRAITHHWFDPCELLTQNARSEMKAEFRQRQQGGGWEMLTSVCSKPSNTT